MPVAIAATLSGDLGRIAAAIQSGGDLNERDVQGRTALHHAVLGGNTKIVEVLLEAGVDVFLADGRGWTALHFAAQEYDAAMVELLVKSGAPVDAEDENGNTPLFRAVFTSRGRGEVVTSLLRHGADKAHENSHGMSPEKLATSISNYDVKQWLR